MRSPRAGRIGKGISPRAGGVAKKKMTSASEKKMQKGYLTQSNYTLVNKSVLKSEVGGNLSISSTVPDYANFKKGEMLNSTEAAGCTPEVTGKKPSYMTPTAAATNRMFKTPTSSVSRSRLGTPNQSKSTPQLSRLRSGRNLPLLF